MSLPKQGDFILLAAQRHCEFKRPFLFTDCLCFSNRSVPCNCWGLEKETKGHLLSLKDRGGCLWPFTGSLWSFAGNLHSFPGGM